MIWSLAKEQLRTQRRYVAWAAGVVTLAVGVATYGALIAVELDEAADATNHALAVDTENAGYVTGTLPGSDVDGVPLEDVFAAVEAARADGHRVGAQATLWALGLEPSSSPEWVPWANAVWGDIDWDAILTSGSFPGAGEVALSESYARHLGVGIGDSVQLYADRASSPLGSAKVSGLTRSPFTSAGLSLTALHDFWIAPEDVAGYSAALTDDNFPVAYPDIAVAWEGESSELTAIFAEVYGYGSYAQSGASEVEGWVWLATSVLVIGAVAMAFAFGRAQAQSRTQWVATARALGATRRHVLFATLLEAGALTAIGALAGYLLGTIGATIHLTAVHAAVPGAGIASAASFSGVAALIAIGLALIVSLVIAGVPAFWAMRVTPASALKPENEITTAEVGRRVKFWPVTLAWVVCGSGAALLSSRTAVATVAAILMLIFVALTPIVANEALRWLLPRCGAWLSRRPEKVALVAGDAITARPRQFTVPALLLALGTGGVLGMASIGALQSATEGWALNFDESFDAQLAYAWPAWLATATTIVLASLAVLATIISIATATVTAQEMSTREALGISARQAQGATGFAHGIALTTGVLTGAVFAAVVVAVNTPHVLATVTQEMGMDWELAMALIFRFHLIVVGAGLAVAVLSGIVVALASRSTTRSTPKTPVSTSA